MNHFIEIGSNKAGYLCVTIHSGSRNPGHSVGGYYMKLSKTEDKGLPEGFLHLESELGQAYIKDMNFMLDFALDNRKLMLKEILNILGFESTHKESIEEWLDMNMINENHNHAIINKDGTVLHRKGATPADKDQYGIIPGNMRDGVYITVGLGNEEFLSSASHGAGRAMSRKKAKENIDHQTFVEQMKGIVSSTDANILDEAPDAYKDIIHVIELQKGVVVDVVDWVKPLINVKGGGSIKPWEKKKSLSENR